MQETLTSKMLAFRSRPSIGTLAVAIVAVIMQGRLIEAVYGALQLFFCAPGKPSPMVLNEELRAEVDAIRRLGEVGTEARSRSRHTLADRWIPHIRVRAHGFAKHDGFVVAGEYADRGSRLFLMTADGVHANAYYGRNPRIRHIHLVHAVDPNHFLVSTGDSARLLDLWRIEQGRIWRMKRLFRFLGGFTAAVTLNGRTYLGTDFSSRPNYILRLDDRRKFFLPSDAFLKFVYYMDVFEDRYLLIASKSLDVIGDDDSVSVFDTRAEAFIR